MSDTYSPQKDSALSYEEAIRACRELAAQGKLKKLFGQPIPPLDTHNSQDKWRVK